MSSEYKFSDFDIDIVRNEFTNDIQMKLDRNSIQQAILNMLLTKSGEKPFNRSFGIGLRDYLFVNFSRQVLMVLRSRIEDAFKVDGRMELDKLTLDESEIDSNKMSLNLQYIVNLNNQTPEEKQSIRIDLSKVR
jgi:phage baseplate assembly protein W